MSVSGRMCQQWTQGFLDASFNTGGADSGPIACTGDMGLRREGAHKRGGAGEHDGRHVES